MKAMRALGRFIFWDYPRASWQYDVMVALILAFIFLTPREFFRDQPKPASVAMVPDRQGVRAYLIHPQLLSGVAEEELAGQASRIVNARYRTHVTIANVEPIYDGDDIKGYMAYAKP